MELRNLVAAVASGKTAFAAASESMPDLEAFQVTAATAREAFSRGYVEHFKPHIEFHSGRQFYDAFMISRVTHAGRRAMQLGDVAA